ncbi:hypothetical protein MKW94_030193, partial [Papaver nudicaule]|nr:hypothetical protein [Papaver nudicaule]
MALQDLPPEEAHNFNRIKEYYRLKKYESGLELANVILENFPNHGETLSLKALLLKSMGQISEAYQLASKGIK